VTRQWIWRPDDGFANSPQNEAKCCDLAPT
jgi:hypothetical protein